MRDVLAILLAGGQGTRLEPLTRDRAKPAVPFAGCYRIIDFTLSNCLNSGMKKILVLTQYKSAGLDRHVHAGWNHCFPSANGSYLEVVPPQRLGSDVSYRGTADAVFKNLHSLEKSGAKYVLVLAGDHVYKMDYRAMVDEHQKSGAAVTVACVRVPVVAAARQFGVMSIDRSSRITEFAEKPACPRPIPGDAEHSLASMGIYVFSTDFLLTELSNHATRLADEPDFGHHVLPRIIDKGLASAHEFRGVDTDRAYWRDVGTLEAYYQASMELLNTPPTLDFFDARWPIRTFEPSLPAPRVLLADRRGVRIRPARANVICPGTTVARARVEGCILGRNCRIEEDAVLENCILFDRVKVGPGATVRRAILDEDVFIEAGAIVDASLARDASADIAVTSNMITCVTKGARIDTPRPTRRNRSTRAINGAPRHSSWIRTDKPSDERHVHVDIEPLHAIGE